MNYDIASREGDFGMLHMFDNITHMEEELNSTVRTEIGGNPQDKWLPKQRSNMAELPKVPSSMNKNAEWQAAVHAQSASKLLAQ